MNNKVEPNCPIILCHGLFGSLSDPTLLEPFNNFTVFAPDLLGYGSNDSVDLGSLDLMDQANHVLSFMDSHKIEQANLVGHSVGGAIAVLITNQYPNRVKSLVSVEGNMTPPDAFWSANLAKKSIDEIQQLIDSYSSDVVGWISDAGVPATSDTLRIATAWLENQPAETLKAQAQAVVNATSSSSDYLKRLEVQLRNGLELHLISGSRSRDGWHIPDRIERGARSSTVIAECGHLMMLESPQKFANAVVNCISDCVS